MNHGAPGGRSGGGRLRPRLSTTMTAAAIVWLGSLGPLGGLAVARPQPGPRSQAKLQPKTELKIELKTGAEPKGEPKAETQGDGKAEVRPEREASAPRPDGGTAPDGGSAPAIEGQKVAGEGGKEAAPGHGGKEAAAKLPPVVEEPLPTRSAQRARGKPPRTQPTDYLLESQNHTGAVARRFVQNLLAGRFDQALHLLEEQGGRRPDFSGLQRAVQAQLESRGAPQRIEQHLVTNLGAELQTFYFTARYTDGSELSARVAVDHAGHVAGAAVGPDVVPAERKRYDRHDGYKTRTRLQLPFTGTWTVSNATPGAGNGHYLNANQRFAIDFFVTQEVDGKRKSYRDSGKQNADYFAFGQEVLAPADGTVLYAVDGVPDNSPGHVDVYYRLGNSVVLSIGQGEYVYLCHLMQGSLQVKPGDHVVRGQVVARVGNSGNSTAPHLHFQLTDGPLITYAASLPAYFVRVVRDGQTLQSVLLRSGDRVANPEAARHASR
ncbi:MAG: peptidoglycan DD-metalloendopeptidase family protein [Polyangia bacterium]